MRCSIPHPLRAGTLDALVPSSGLSGLYYHARDTRGTTQAIPYLPGCQVECAQFETCLPHRDSSGDEVEEIPQHCGSCGLRSTL
jgi:hypothetical protein